MGKSHHDDRQRQRQRQPAIDNDNDNHRRRKRQRDDHHDDRKWPKRLCEDETIIMMPRIMTTMMTLRRIGEADACEDGDSDDNQIMILDAAYYGADGDDGNDYDHNAAAAAAAAEC